MSWQGKGGGDLPVWSKFDGDPGPRSNRYLSSFVDAVEICTYGHSC